MKTSSKNIFLFFLNILFLNFGYETVAQAVDWLPGIDRSRKIEKMIEDAQPKKERAESIQARQKLLQKGSSIYVRFCTHCHGQRGDGSGNASHYLFPTPGI